MLETRLGTGLEGFPSELWKRLRSGRPRLLMLDYDGTLAPFEVDRMSARMPDRSARALRRIAAEIGDFVAIVSGRSLDELIALAGDLPVQLVGSHGWEQRTAEGHRVWTQPSPLVVERLGLAREAARDAGWGERVEAKPSALMLHTRGMPADEARRLEQECENLWGRLFLREGLSMMRVDGGVELRAAAFDKGRVVRELCRRHSEARVVAYLGDDTADESAFEALREHGITVRVGADARPTRALWRLESPQVVARFLERWADSVH